GTEHVAIARRKLRNLRCKHLRNRLRIGGVGHSQHAVDAGDLRGLGGGGGGVGGQHDDVDRFGRQRLRGGHAFGGGGVELAVVVFGDDEDFGHVRSLCFHRSRIGGNPVLFVAASRW